MQQYKGNKEHRAWLDLNLMDSTKIANHRENLKALEAKLANGNFAWHETAESIAQDIESTKRTLAYLKARLAIKVKANAIEAAKRTRARNKAA